ncbi:MAG: 50S ribosomal protein L11 methyltransferase [Legionellales bacterium]|nr:50S ribosomal protein L11 methyltransferase [Legionellales bacterium]|tara:strand:- start:228 stop:1103 length:876 start_codon:yes stop_codon:yes gene_type:complete
MAWIEVRFDTRQPLNEVHEELCFSLGAQAVTYLENGLDEIWEPEPNEDTMFSDATLVALFDATENIKAITDALSQALPKQSIQVNPLEDKEWSRAWMDQFEPMCFGKNLWICPSWKTPPEPDACIVRLDPGIAFGTGTHPTTAMCLTVLDSLDCQNASIIDYGCGSGILGIAAALKGAKTVSAVDHCEQALNSTRANARENAITEACLNTFLPQNCPSVPADIVLANILAGPLVSLAPTLCELTQAEGLLVLSGLLANQKEAVTAAYTPFCTIEDIHMQGEWCCLVLRRFS